MKWQMVPRYGKETTTVKHYGLLKFFGAKLRHRSEIDCFEFRPAYFTILQMPAPFVVRRIFSIPIPWMKTDFVISWRHFDSLF